MRLIFPTYRSADPAREAELRECESANLRSALFRSVVCVVSDSRPTYRDLFSLADPNDVNVVCNGDITFDETIRLAYTIRPMEVYTLTRWEHGHLQYQAYSSQDAWVFRGRLDVDAPVEIGRWGCDNRLAYILELAGYRTWNPSHSIHVHHHHESNVHTYVRDDAARTHGYWFVHPCRIEDVR